MENQQGDRRLELCSAYINYILTRPIRYPGYTLPQNSTVYILLRCTKNIPA